MADTLNLAKITPTLGQVDVVAVSAMEAVGVAQAIERYAALKSGRRIPYTNVSLGVLYSRCSLLRGGI